MSVEIIDYRKFEKNTLKGFLTARLTTIGLEIRDIALHEKNGQRWLQMPSKPYEKDGEKKWSYILDFYQKKAKEAFQKKTLEALEKHRQKHG